MRLFYLSFLLFLFAVKPIAGQELVEIERIAKNNPDSALLLIQQNHLDSNTEKFVIAKIAQNQGKLKKANQLVFELLNDSLLKTDISLYVKVKLLEVEQYKI